MELQADLSQVQLISKSTQPSLTVCPLQNILAPILDAQIVRAACLQNETSEKVSVSQERVSGVPEKGADLRGSSGNFRGSLGNFRGTLGNFRGTSGCW